MKTKLMRPVVDYAFKALFGSNKRKSKIILIDLLNNILNLQKKNKIKSIQHLNPFNNKEFSEDKLSILDVKVKTEKDNLIDIEMQINQLDNYKKEVSITGANYMRKPFMKHKLMKHCKNP